jgi:hypothetical protein
LTWVPSDKNTSARVRLYLSSHRFGAWLLYRRRGPKQPAWLACRRLGPFRAVDAVETDAFRVVIVQDFDSVAVEDGDNEAREVGSLSDGKPTEK